MRTYLLQMHKVVLRTVSDGKLRVEIFNHRGKLLDYSYFEAEGPPRTERGESTGPKPPFQPKPTEIA